MPGKSSNVNHAVRQVSTQLESDAILTILDADAEVCEKYVTELDKIANMRDIFAAPILFDMNTDTTPFMVCVNDFMWAAMAIQNMNPITGVVGFPMSAYSMSLNLVRRVQFWDMGHVEGDTYLGTVWARILQVRSLMLCPFI